MDFYLERLRDEIAAATDGLDTMALTWHPEGKWSTAEILEHLYLTYTGTIKGFERCLKAEKPMARKPTLNDRVKAWVVVGLGHLPEGRVAPKNTRPQGLAPERVLADIRPKISEMDAIIATVETKYGELTRVLDHPILGPLRAQQWRKFHWVHGQLHLKQIRRLRAGAANQISLVELRD